MDRPADATNRRRLDGRHVLSVSLVVVLFTAPMAMAGPSGVQIDGEARAAAVTHDGAPMLGAQAYLLGFWVRGGDDSPYDWSFRADEVDIRMEDQKYRRVGLQPIYEGNSTTRTHHENASGSLVQRWDLAYFMAVGEDPSDPGSSFNIRSEIGLDEMVPQEQIEFSTDPPSGATPLPAGEQPGSARYNREFNREWMNLGMQLDEAPPPITLSGDFTVYLFDMDFQVKDAAGVPTLYKARFGDTRGNETPAPYNEFNDTRAEIRFQNATMTFVPAGRPVQVNLRAADLNASGPVYLSDAHGELTDGRGVDTMLDGALLELDAIHVNIAMAARSESPPVFDVTFAGAVRSAMADGSAISIQGPTGTTGETPQQTEAVLPQDVGDQGGWNLLLLFFIPLALVASWQGKQRIAIHRRPERYVEKSQQAFDAGRIRRSDRIIRRVLRRHPDHSEAIMIKAAICLRSRDAKRAVELLAPHVGGQRDHGGLLSLLYCAALQAMGHGSRAKMVFEDAMDGHPDLLESSHAVPGFDPATLYQEGRDEGEVAFT